MNYVKSARYPLSALFLIALWYFAPYIIFDTSRAGRDENMEYYDGKEVAWGPAPRSWLLGVELTTTLYNGDEFFYRYYKGFCLKWLSERNMVRPPNGQ